MAWRSPWLIPSKPSGINLFAGQPYVHDICQSLERLDETRNL
jgi:hypothetical protein